MGHPFLPLFIAAEFASAGASGQEAVGTTVVTEPRGTTIVVEGDRVLRQHGMERSRLLSIEGRGTGEVHDLAADPAGLTFFAAENGVFVVGPSVEHLDQVNRKGEAPSGVPRSVHVDAQRRVWLATDTSVGSMDPSFGWGRTLGPEDGLHLAPPYRLTAVDGGLRVEGTPHARTSQASGASHWVYQPDEGSQPTVDEVRVNGETAGEGTVMPARYGGALDLAAAGTAAGGARFRYRIDHHHVWRDLGDQTPIGRMNPGEHLIEVVAYDRDLNLSRPFPLRVAVSMPFYFGKWFVLGVGALISLIVFTFAVALQRPGTKPLRRALAGAATTAIILVFGVQILAGLIPHAKGWPFVGYSMYSKSFRPEIPVHRAVLIARDQAGTERELPPWSLGYAIDGRWQILGPIVTGGPEVERDALERVRQRFPKPNFNVLQVQSRRFRLTGDGPVPIAPLILSHFVGVPDQEGGGR